LIWNPGEVIDRTIRKSTLVMLFPIVAFIGAVCVSFVIYFFLKTLGGAELSFLTAGYTKK
jgi:hypothetical protein